MLKKDVFLLAFAQASKILSQAAGIYVYSRVLGPEAVGVMAIAMIVVNFSNIFKDFGTSAAIIQKKYIDNIFLSSIFWLNFCNGLIISVVVYFSADMVASFFKMKDVAPVLRLLAFVFPVVSVSLVGQALVERKLKFSVVSVAEVSASYFGTFVGCYSAYSGFGAKSLAIQSIASAGVLAVFYLASSRWVPNFSFRISDIGEINKFSGNYTLFTIVNYLSRNSDTFVIGKFMGEKSAGLYAQAYKIMMIPLQLLSSVSNRLLFPLLSRGGDNEYFVRVYFSSIELVALFASMFSLVLLMGRDYIVILLMGDKWTGVSDLLVYMVPAGLLQSLISTTGSVFMAKGRTDIQLKLGVIGATLMLLAFLSGVFFELNDMVKFYLAATIVNSLPCFFVTSKILGCSVVNFIKAIVPYFIFLSISYVLYCNFKDDSDVIGSALKMTFSLSLYLILSLVYAYFQGKTQVLKLFGLRG